MTAELLYTATFPKHKPKLVYSFTAPYPVESAHLVAEHLTQLQTDEEADQKHLFNPSLWRMDGDGPVTHVIEIRSGRTLVGTYEVTRTGEEFEAQRIADQPKRGPKAKAKPEVAP